jgi:hypothetical protein
MEFWGTGGYAETAQARHAHLFPDAIVQVRIERSEH